MGKVERRRRGGNWKGRNLTIFGWIDVNVWTVYKNSLFGNSERAEC